MLHEVSLIVALMTYRDLLTDEGFSPYRSVDDNFAAVENFLIGSFVFLIKPITDKRVVVSGS